MTKYKVIFRTPIPMPKDKQPDCSDVTVELNPVELRGSIVNVVIDDIRFYVPMSNVLAIQLMPESDDDVSDFAKEILRQTAGISV